MVTAAVIVKLLARGRTRPGWFIDSTRARALTVIGTMFAVLLAFTIFYALQNYQRARDGQHGSHLESPSCTTWPTWSRTCRVSAAR